MAVGDETDTQWEASYLLSHGDNGIPSTSFAINARALHGDEATIRFPLGNTFLARLAGVALLLGYAALYTCSDASLTILQRNSWARHSLWLNTEGNEG